MYCDGGRREVEMYDMFQREDTFGTLKIGIMALQELGRCFFQTAYYIKGGRKKSIGREST